MKKLFYVRHGETETNYSGVWAGHIETPLTKKGIKQAKAAGKSLKNKIPPIDLIISSPLSRAYDTAKFIAKEIGYPIKDIQKNSLFIERNFGELEGTSSGNSLVEKFMREMENIKGIEKLEDLHKRAAEALVYIKQLPQDNILVVSHGSFGRAFRRVVENIPYHHEYLASHRDKYRIGNAEIVEII